MTPDDKIKLIVEAAGEKWQPKYIQYEDSDGIPCQVINDSKNPSTHSLDDLVALAEKLGIDLVTFDKYRGIHKIELVNKNHRCGIPVYYQGEGTTKAEALLNALVKAVEGREHHDAQ